MTATADAAAQETGRSGVGKIALASLVGTTIEFYDFYIFGTAAALVFGPMFFPKSAPETQTAQRLCHVRHRLPRPPARLVSVRPFRRPDRTQVDAGRNLLTMGVATTLIGLLPSYATAGGSRRSLSRRSGSCRGVGLGGEWGGAALVAVENAPEGRRAWFGMFPQLGPPIGFFIATGLFLLLLVGFGEEAFVAWSWRIPFLFSAALVAVGLYVRYRSRRPRRSAPRSRPATGSRSRSRRLSRIIAPLIQGSLAIVVCYALFYIATVYALGYGVRALGIPRPTLLAMLCGAVVFMAAATPVSAALADRFGRRPVLLASAVVAIAVGLAMPWLMASGLAGVFAFLALALGAMGLTFAPLGALLPELFPVPVRYTGAASAYNLGGILGASFAPSLAQVLEGAGGVAWVGYYIAIAGLISFLAVLSMRETRDGPTR